MENPIVPEQASEDGDALATEQVGQTVNVISQEETGTAEKKNKDAKEWRKSDKEWQEMQEKAKKGETAAQILENLSKALGVQEPKEGEEEKETDPLKVVTQKVDELQTELALAKWEKSHPAVDTAEYREAWTEIVKTKGHLVKSGDLTYDDLWAMIRKGSKPSTSNRDFKNQELNIGSIPTPSKSFATGSEIDPDVYKAMKMKGWTDDQIKMSA